MGSREASGPSIFRFLTCESSFTTVLSSIEEFPFHLGWTMGQRQRLCLNPIWTSINCQPYPGAVPLIGQAGLQCVPQQVIFLDTMEGWQSNMGH